MLSGLKHRWDRLPRRLQFSYFLIILAVAIGLATFVSLAATGQIGSQAAANQASLSVWSGNQNYPVGTVFPIYIQLSADQGTQIEKIQVASLNYDTTMVEVAPPGIQSFPLANLETATNQIEVDGGGNPLGKIDYVLTSSGSSYVDGSAVIVAINFKVLKAGQATFSLDPYNSADPTRGAAVLGVQGSNILTTANPSTIALGVPATPTPVSVPGTTTQPAANSGTVTAPTTNQTTTTTIKKPSTGSKTTTKKVVVTPEPVAVEPLPEAAPIVEEPVAETPEVEVKGFSATTLFTYAGISAVLTIIAFWLWFNQRKKPHLAKAGNKEPKKKKKFDDDELI